MHALSATGHFSDLHVRYLEWAISPERGSRYTLPTNAKSVAAAALYRRWPLTGSKSKSSAADLPPSA
jgi:hypothetical protein